MCNSVFSVPLIRSQRKDEIQAMTGAGQPFGPFYEQLNEIKTFHVKYPYLTIERPEAEQIYNRLETYDNLFTGEESYGKYLDLHSFYQTYINFKEVPKDLEYRQYLEIFYTFPHRNVGMLFANEPFLTLPARNKEYEDYLTSLYEYLVGFFRRSQPLFNIEPTLNQFVEDFNRSWDEGTFAPVGYNETDQANGVCANCECLIQSEENPLWCKYSRKLFASEGAYKGYLKGKNFQKAKKWHDTSYKVRRLFGRTYFSEHVPPRDENKSLGLLLGRAS